MASDPHTIHPLTPEGKVVLVRSIAGHAQGREDDALREIGEVLCSATLEQLVAARLGGGR